MVRTIRTAGKSDVTKVRYLRHSGLSSRELWGALGVHAAVAGTSPGTAKRAFRVACKARFTDSCTISGLPSHLRCLFVFCFQAILRNFELINHFLSILVL